jgi:hypothetical protein
MPSAPAPASLWPAPYQQGPAPYQHGAAPYQPEPAHYQPEPAAYQPEPAPYQPGAAPYRPEPAPYQPASFTPPVAEPLPFAPPVAEPLYPWPGPPARGGGPFGLVEPGPARPHHDEGAAPAADPEPVWGSAPSREDSPADLRDLIAALTARSGELFGVTDTAQVLADDLVERAEADAAAVLVPDGPLWRVSGSVGLRPPERQAVLDAHHWVIAQIALGGQVLLLQDTALARPKLAGAPLATWRHVLAVPVPAVQALVILARGPAARPFAEADLARVAGPVAEAAALLATAIQTRRMARLLAPLCEDDGVDAP